MQEEQIPAFVQAVVDLGCDNCAVGHVGYVFGDADLSPRLQDEIAQRVREIHYKFGERDHLKPKIIAHLRSIGRFIDIPDHCILRPRFPVH